jgi:hypothetical protein
MPLPPSILARVAELIIEEIDRNVPNIDLVLRLAWEIRDHAEAISPLIEEIMEASKAERGVAS